MSNYINHIIIQGDFTGEPVFGFHRRKDKPDIPFASFVLYTESNSYPGTECTGHEVSVTGEYYVELVRSFSMGDTVKVSGCRMEKRDDDGNIKAVWVKAKKIMEHNGNPVNRPY
jgi:hypothetical protein